MPAPLQFLVLLYSLLLSSPQSAARRIVLLFYLYLLFFTPPSRCSHCFRRYSCSIGSRSEGRRLIATLNVDRVDYFARFLFLFLKISSSFCSSPISPLPPLFHIVLVHIVTYCSHRTTTKHLPSPTFTFTSIHPPIIPTRFWFLLFSPFPFFFNILLSSHWIIPNPLSSICKTHIYILREPSP